MGWDEGLGWGVGGSEGGGGQDLESMWLKIMTCSRILCTF